ncbi:zinc finger MYM-type protein 1-like [Pholidichthys leucotaenia]
MAVVKGDMEGDGVTKEEITLGCHKPEEPYMQGRHHRLSPSEAQKILHDSTILPSGVPFRRDGGEVFVIEPDYQTKDSWRRADGYEWHNNGTARIPRKNPVVIKTYFYIKLPQGPSRDFTKAVYTLIPPGKRVIIHYLGDSALAVPAYSGNASKKRKTYFRKKGLLVRDKRAKLEGWDPAAEEMFAGVKTAPEMWRKPKMKSHTSEQYAFENELLDDQWDCRKERNSRLNQEEPEPHWIKEEPFSPPIKKEQEEDHLLVKQETNGSVGTPANEECDEPEPNEEQIFSYGSGTFMLKGNQNPQITCDGIGTPTSWLSDGQVVQHHSASHLPAGANGHGFGQVAVPVEAEKMRENSVISLQKYPFTQRSTEQQTRVKELGPDRPDVQIQQCLKDRVWSFTCSYHDSFSWLAGCNVSNAFYCFPCLLFQSADTETLWTTAGVRDLKHLLEECRRHESCRSHLDNMMKLKLFGRAGIVGHRAYSEEVAKKQRVLSRIIDCLKFCGAFDLALHGHDESDSSDNPGILPGLVDLVASLDGAMKEHLQNAAPLKGTLKMVQNELLDCMLSVAREQIIKEAQSSDFISIHVEEMMDVSIETQLLLVLRYIDGKNNVQERFFESIHLQSSTPESIATVLKERLAAILPEQQKGKLICQSYDGSSAKSGVQRRIKDVYPNAHYIHSYAHRLNQIIAWSTLHLPRVRIFLSDLGGFASFFARSPKRAGVLDEVVAHRLKSACAVRWNSDSRAISTVYEHREDLISCFERIRHSYDFNHSTVREAGALRLVLEDDDFNFFLEFFYYIIPLMDLFEAKLQNKKLDLVKIKNSIQQFHLDIQKIRNCLHSKGEKSRGSLAVKRHRTLSPQDCEEIGGEVCDAVLKHTSERFSFTDHLLCATLVRVDRFEEFNKAFPKDALSSILKAYPMLSGGKLETELSLIYSKEEFRACRGAVDLFQLFMQNNLEEVFSETVTLLKVVITTPMITEEPERCFSTLKRIKTFLGKATTQERLNALAMLSVEKRLVIEMTDFNQRVIEKFAGLKERRAEFMF